MEQKNSSQMYNRAYIDINTAVHNTDSNLSAIPKFHKNFEILIVLDGYCNCEINGQEFLVKKGEAVFIFPFQMHKFSLGESSSIRHITFHHHLILTISQAVDGKIPKNPVFRPSENLLNLSLDFIENSFGHDSGPITRIAPFEKRMQTKGILYMLGGEFLSSTELAAAPKSSTLITEIIKYISENFRRNITLKDIAKEKGYNYQYISRIFNNATELNFKKILNQFRLEYAFELLQDTDMSISNICFESGFQSVRSFNQICKEEFGKTPKELRNPHI